MPRLFYKIRCRLAAIFRRNGKNDELAREIEQHIEMSVADLVSQGTDPEEARKLALREFGNVEALKEECQDSWGMRFIDNRIRDLGFGCRQMIKHKGLSSVVIVTLAFGIGLNTAVFTVINTLVFKPVIPHEDSLVVVKSRNLKEGAPSLPVSYPDFVDFRNQNKTFETLESFRNSHTALSVDGDFPTALQTGFASSALLRLIGMQPALGRDFSQDDLKIGASPVVVIGHQLWISRFAEDPSVLGNSIQINDRLATIIGVMPKPLNHRMWPSCWMPMHQDKTLKTEDRANRDLFVLGTLKEGASLKQARLDISLISQRIASDYESNEDIDSIALTLRDATVIPGGRGALMLSLLQMLVGLVLLIACANIANLTLGRAIQRRFEIAVRAAIGASRWQIIRQLLTESLIFSAIGGLLSLAVTYFSIWFFISLLPQENQPIENLFNLDHRVFAFLITISVGSGLLFGIAPAIRVARYNHNAALNNNVHSAGSRRGGKLSGTLAVFQIAVAIALLTSAGLMLRALLSLGPDNEFIPDDETLVSGIILSPKINESYLEESSRSHFHRELLRRAKELPGVTHAALTSGHVGLMKARRQPIEIAGEGEGDATRPAQTYTISHSPEYLSAIELPILQGRDFTNTDELSGEPVAIVSKQFAQTNWPDQSAIGKRIRFMERSGPGPWRSIIGISADVILEPMDIMSNLVVFTPSNESAPHQMILVVRAPVNPQSKTDSIRKVIQELDPLLPQDRIQIAKDFKDRKSQGNAAITTMLIAFAMIALCISTIGIYAVVAQSASSRIREMGIRKTLGASTSAIQRLALSRGLIQLIFGLIIGLPLSIVLAKIIQKAVYFTQSGIVVFAMVVPLIISISLLACWLPARKASLVNPSDTLRVE